MTPPASTATSGSPKQQFLKVYEDEHARTMRVLRAFPADQAELRPHERLRTARELAFVFAIERGLGTMVFNGAFAAPGGPSGGPPEAPTTWDAVLAAVEQTHREFGEFVRALPDERLDQPVTFFVAPKTLGDIRGMDFLWLLLHDQIHHRGQFSVYVRLAGGKVPAIYGGSADEPWF